MNTIRKLVDELEGLAAIAGSGRNTPVYSDHGDVIVELAAGRVRVSLSQSANSLVLARSEKERRESVLNRLNELKAAALDLLGEMGRSKPRKRMLAAAQKTLRDCATIIP